MSNASGIGMSAGRLVAIVCTAQVLVQIGAYFWPALLPGFIEPWGLNYTQAGWITAVFYGAYMLSVIDRGADILRASNGIAEETAATLKAEARRRVEAGTFFGHIAYASLTARKPA